jgi:hypothetical protein
MSARVPWAVLDGVDENSAKRREESDWMLNAIVGAIATGKLPPDDACAWAKIAAYEVEMLRPGTTAPLATTTRYTLIPNSRPPLVSGT